MSEPEQWYWDLDKQRAVPASDRGRSDNTLGPYGSRAEAEDWRAKTETRNDAWKEADDEWNNADPSDG